MAQLSRRKFLHAAARLAGVCGATSWGAPLMAQSATPTIVEIIVAEQSAAHNEAADALKEALNGKYDTHIVALDAWDPAKRTRATLRVALGTNAFRAALADRGGLPIVAALLPRTAYERVLRAAPAAEGRVVTGIYLDQPFTRQLNLIRLAMPNKTRLAVIGGNDSSESIAALQSTARAERMTVHRETVADERDVYSALRRALEDTDVLLALPDSTVYNSATIHNIFATAYRAQVPVFGFSPAYVRAGALAAVYSTPRQIARQTAELLLRQLSAGAPAWPAPQYPRYFTVSTNPTVERALGLTIDDDSVLTTKLQRLERE